MEKKIVILTPPIYIKKSDVDIGLELPECWLSMLLANHPPEYNKQ